LLGTTRPELFDEGAQHLFREFSISPTSTTDVLLALFGSTSRSHQKLGFATVEIEIITRERISISVLIVPIIAAPILPYKPCLGLTITGNLSKTPSSVEMHPTV